MSDIEPKILKKVVESLSETSSSYSKKIPCKTMITDILKRVRSIMFPNYFRSDCSESTDLELEVKSIYADLREQIVTAILFESSNTDFESASKTADNICNSFFEELPNVKKKLLGDVEAGFLGDPAAKSREDIIISYPGMLAVFVYRIANILYKLNVPIIPRIMTEYAHSRSGIDINAGATIGEHFFIDHGTGVVIGETTIIGDNVKLYQGVTLGALSTRKGQSLAGIKRHPTIESNVTIYSNATILGGNTVIGNGSIIGGSAFITQSIPPNTKVMVKNQELILKNSEGCIWEI